MNAPKQALVLVGSARRPRSTSEALGTYLLERLSEKGFETKTLLLHRELQSEERQAKLLDETDRADVLVVAFPLYVDSLPTLVIRAFELIAAHRQDGDQGRAQRLLVIANCGFPEAHHNDTTIAICRRFAEEASFDWAGGLTLGGGGAIGGRPLVEVGGAARFAIGALDLAATAIAESQPLPKEAIETMAKPVIPAWAYRWIGWLGWRVQARQNGVQKQIFARPYEA